MASSSILIINDKLQQRILYVYLTYICYTHYSLLVLARRLWTLGTSGSYRCMGSHLFIHDPTENPKAGDNALCFRNGADRAHRIDARACTFGRRPGASDRGSVERYVVHCMEFRDSRIYASYDGRNRHCIPCAARR